MRTFSLTSLAVALSFLAHSQIILLDLAPGVSYYGGEFNPSAKMIHLKPSGSAHLRWALSKRHAFKVGYSFFRIEGDDSKGKYENFTDRNLYFRNDIHEISAIGEVNFREYKPCDMRDSPWTPYLFAGIGVFRMNPKGYYNDNLIELQPLGTEGQGSGLSTREKYRLTQISIPIGVGLRINMNESSTISFQYGLRMTFTDFLDDVSGYYVNNAALAAQNGVVSAAMADKRNDEARQLGALRGNPNTKDYIFQGSVCLSIKLKGPKICDMFGKKFY
jgi:hypothetical protein